MIEEVKKLMDKYLIWLREKTILREVEDWVEITTPYLDRHNDYLQIYVKRNNGGYIISDDSYIIEDLRQSGCELESKKRKELLKLTLNGFGVKLEGNALTITASEDNFALRKHNLVQAMLVINDLFYVSKPAVISLFLEDVAAWLDLHKIRYIARINFIGKSGYNHSFDFAIPPSEKNPERIIKTINHPDREIAQAYAFAWIDTKETRPPNSKAYAFINNTDHESPSSVINALKNYDINPVLWSNIEEMKEELVA